MSHTDSEADPLVALAEEFADRYRRGERPSLSEYAGRYPEHADRIRRLFPAMVAMEQLGSSAEWSGGRPAGPRAGAVPERLGEYRILREIARGGMGVVYEAVQESLGRHVALKVLPLHRLVRESQLERFRREARAAARLHHSNIVPVFGVGESDGVHYYAMPFIQGQNLDAVLQEVRRLRGVPAEARPDATRPSGLGAGLARDLISGGPGRTLAAVAEPAATGSPPEPEPPPSAPAGSSPTIVEATAPGIGSERAARPEIPYIRGVARIGLQVAEALDCAHQQGILHRDIKPANILLDTQGTAWVTDFGLAQAEDSAERTGRGDIVGTLRYMAPERFGGRADRRGDVYGLGLTLYEMLTLRSGFTSGDRARLIQRILHDEPPRPRRVDPRIPRDLETIVLKAMAKDPARRYATAAALAEDLRRFLSDRPIRARRTSAWEHARRFCRRNPALAMATGAAASLLAVLVALWADRTARLDAELRRTSEARRAEQAARRDAQDRLWRSYLARAQAGRFARRPGRRLDGLEALRQAVPIARSVDAPPSAFDELRDEAIACLAPPDLRPGEDALDIPASSHGPAFDGPFRRYAVAGPGRDVRVHRLGQAAPIARMAGLPATPYGLWMSPDGGRLVNVTADAKAVHVWDLRAIARRLGELGLHDELVASRGAGGPDTRPGRTAEVRLDPSASLVRTREQEARDAIDRARGALDRAPDGPLECNDLAWDYLMAPAPLRDPARAPALAEKAVRLRPDRPVFRNTLGVAYYRAGRHRDAVETFRAGLDRQEDRYLAWDLCFLAMSYHRLGDRERAREYRDWALRWARDGQGLSPESIKELSLIREEMEATLGR